MSQVRFANLLVAVLLSTAASLAQTLPATERADRADPRFWIARAADIYLQDEAHGTDVDWLIEALAFAGDDERLRAVVADWADRVAGAPDPIAAIGYATVAFGYARLGDAEAYALAGDQAVALAQDTDEAFRNGV